MTKQEAFDEINSIQDAYIDELVSRMHDPNYEHMRTINFSSPTGTGKTKMMSKLINRFPDVYFIVTTLSKGQLHIQIRSSLERDCVQDNFHVYGCADYKINSRLQANDILNAIPVGAKCIWLRDEGHIRTNRFEELLMDKCYKVINFSATNTHGDIQCNFTQTMMLRTVNQAVGTPEDAIAKLLEVKDAHRNVPGYNPCAIFRCVSGNDVIYDEIVALCDKHHLKYIDVTTESFDMSELCEDDNEYDVIINKFKIVEGIDIRRAHVLYMDNQPANNATTIQVIGRCRRNALLYRDDIDILSSKNRKLLELTRECYVYYNVESMKIDTDENGELQSAFCNQISCEELRPGSVVQVKKGRLANGLYILELEGRTGKFQIVRDECTGFNVVSPVTSFYDDALESYDNYVYVYVDGGFKKVKTEQIPLYPLRHYRQEFSYYEGKPVRVPCEPYYVISESARMVSRSLSCDEKCVLSFDEWARWFIRHVLYGACIECLVSVNSDLFYRTFGLYEHDVQHFKRQIRLYLRDNAGSEGLHEFRALMRGIKNYEFRYNGEVHRLGDLLSRLGEVFGDGLLSLLKYCCLDLVKKGCPMCDVYDMLDFVAVLLYEASLYGRGYGRWNDVEKIIGYLYCSGIFRSGRLLTVELLVESLSFYSRYSSDGDLVVTKADVSEYFASLRELFNSGSFVFSYTVIEPVVRKIFDGILSDLRNGFVCEGTSLYLEDVTNYELDLLRRDELKCYGVRGRAKHSCAFISKKEYDALPKCAEYQKFVNDRESAIVGVDLMHPVNGCDAIRWMEAKAVSSKVGNYNKLNTFLSVRYKSELEYAKIQCFRGKNEFKLDKRCNSMLGYCVEYYSKWLVYGDLYLFPFINKAQRESRTDDVNDCIIVRACMLKYKDMMVRSFGKGVSRVISGISIQSLVQEKYRYFVNLVVELGTKTANYVRAELYSDRPAVDDVDPNLSVRHITGLADYITRYTILDVKVRNNIDENCVRQVLAYHYLSTKRSDLDIKRVIVYDAVSGRSVVIPIEQK